MYVWLSGTWLLLEANQKVLKLPDDSGRNRSLEIMDELFQSNFGGKAESNSNLTPKKQVREGLCESFIAFSIGYLPSHECG